MVILLITNERSLNGSAAKQHAPGVRVTGTRVLNGAVPTVAVRWSIRPPGTLDWKPHSARVDGRRRRIDRQGPASRYTRSRLPAVMVYQEPQASQSHALKREAAIKTMSRLAKESLIQHDA